MNKPDPGPVALVFRVLGSLRLTVALIGMSIFLVFAGTLAQREGGIWPVIAQYFRCWIAWIDLRIFLPREQAIPGGFPFPGGTLLGTALAINLFVSHIQRIQLKARGLRLALGGFVLGVGLLLTWITISHVFDQDSSETVIDPSWRVTLQLLQGVGTAAVLFMGCWMLFRKKAGIVLLHGGVILMMTTELVAQLLAEEGNMTISEGQKVGYVEDTRKVELAFIDSSDSKMDDVVAMPQGLLVKGKVHPVGDLPIEYEVVEFLGNSAIREAREGDVNAATHGLGRHWVAKKRNVEAGADSSGRVDLPAAYVKFRRKGGESLGTWLVSLELTVLKEEQVLQVDDKKYRIALRFKRTYKPYSVYLHDFKFEYYPGTKTPKDFSAYVRLEDPERDTTRDVRIWMNNPLRYRGDTLYQSSWDGTVGTTTTLQVVDNAGWMVPYVACMIVAVGLLGQFIASLLTFLAGRGGA